MPDFPPESQEEIEQAKAKARQAEADAYKYIKMYFEASPESRRAFGYSSLEQLVADQIKRTDKELHRIFGD